MFVSTLYMYTISKEVDNMRIDVSSNKHFKHHPSTKINASTRSAIFAADEDDPGFGDFEDEPDFGMTGDSEDGFEDTLDDMADNIEDMQDDLDEVQEDDTSIEVENNIEGHYIAECDRCHGIFISAMVQSDQEVEKMSGICPLCQKESDQYFKWVVQAIE